MVTCFGKGTFLAILRAVAEASAPEKRFTWYPRSFRLCSVAALTATVPPTM